MAKDNLYLAVFLGSQTTPQFAAWLKLSDAERAARGREGIAAWKKWAADHAAQIVEMGGPLGKTKKVSSEGIADISNDMGGFTVVRAASHEEAAKLFAQHPHFTIFPGDRIEVMPVMPVPAG